ncbi:hypothetical protein BDF14DRAFT_1089596 [Spinellus fusiger]|nr:hypothetical protein BDF14DRAFT_1089596 [Spinellus fusiger]
MSLENISVSLSRLALARAIKTPDDKECEPWTKSVIFHQPHVDAAMRELKQNPQRQRQGLQTRHQNPQSFSPTPRHPPATARKTMSASPSARIHSQYHSGPERRMNTPTTPTAGSFNGVPGGVPVGPHGSLRGSPHESQKSRRSILADKGDYLYST